MPRSDGYPSEYAERVLEFVRTIPAGKVMTYGDVAEYLGAGSARSVGAVMATWGADAPWWRVVFADGTPPSSRPERALRRYAAEGTPMLPAGGRVDMVRARWAGPFGPGAADPV
ncbi:MAG TPA: MGMT family protein [Thermobifida alba]|uniref:Cysteine methyltransferase n=1 Tax=Thermobifida cellulosilytica TB100 TaxID=665004 RepID=A0A147KH59_THECS|nr:MGMT family protein [Thermobifida cellulosilytica]KUP96644.1 cysteine methyltransferase [Thermobifida cellulosilytica TB100]HLU97378.1 MGMT family protein [Thermobifida alba]